MRKLSQLGWQAAVEKDEAIGGSGNQLPGECNFPFFASFRAPDDDADIVFFERLLDPQYDVRMGESGNVWNNDEDLVGFSGSEHASIMVRNVTAFPGDLCNSRTRLRGHGGRSREGPTDSGWIDACEPGDINDRDARLGSCRLSFGFW